MAQGWPPLDTSYGQTDWFMVYDDDGDLPPLVARWRVTAGHRRMEVAGFPDLTGGNFTKWYPMPAYQPAEADPDQLALELAA